MERIPTLIVILPSGRSSLFHDPQRLLNLPSRGFLLLCYLPWHIYDENRVWALWTGQRVKNFLGFLWECNSLKNSIGFPFIYFGSLPSSSGNTPQIPFFFNSVHMYACACVSAGVNIMIATLRTSTTLGWEDITLYLIFATRLSTLIQRRHLTGPLHLKSFMSYFLFGFQKQLTFPWGFSSANSLPFNRWA